MNFVCIVLWEFNATVCFSDILVGGVYYVVFVSVKYFFTNVSFVIMYSSCEQSIGLHIPVCNGSCYVEQLPIFLNITPCV